jgi:hypothetical protein
MKSYILPATADREKLVLDVSQALKAVEAALGHKYVYRGPREAQPGVIGHTWTDLRHAITVMLGVDDVIPARYLSIEAEGDLEPIGRLLSGKLSALSRDTLVAQARHFDQDPGAILRLAMASDDKDDEVLDLLAQALAGKDKRARANAAMGATFVRWPELVKPLKTALKNEKDAGVKRLIKAAIEMSED